MQKLRKNDPVQVIAGKYKGTISVITKRLGDLVVVEGVNIQKRAKKGE
jgi:ribosomal protein L24